MGLKDEDILIQDNIQEYVHDENKIVTFKWLSLTLSVPVNTAKLALFHFVDSSRQSGNNDDLNVTYFLSGFETKDGGIQTFKCVVVPESHLDSMKKTLNPVTSCHVYSVQKAKLKDYTPLYQTDYDICRENAETINKFSSISCPWAVLRDDQSVPKQATNNSPAPKTKTSDKGSEASKTSSTSPSSTKASTDAKDDKKAAAGNKKSGIASMFAAAGKKEKEKKSDSRLGSTEDESRTSSSKPKGDGAKKKGIESLFKAQPKKADVKEVKKEKEVSPEQADTQNTKKNNKSKPEKSQKHKLSGSDEPQKKKRRRIRNDLFDSSDEEKDNNDDDDEDVNVEMSDGEDVGSSKESEPEPDDEKDEVKRGMDDKEELDDKEEAVEEMKREKKTIVVKDGKKRKRTRKLVPQQHIDEDGFMVTEKVWVSDSTDASDEEEETTEATAATATASSKASSSSSPSKASKATKPAAPVNKKKPPAVSPSKNKQTSLMSFFKKK